MAAFTTLAIALALGGTATSVVGQVKAGRAAKKQGEAAGKAAESAGYATQAAAESQAGIADYNAQVADLQAADATARGQQEENKFRAGVRGIVGSQRAGIAAGNIDVSSGSAVDVQADSAFLGELDALTIRTNAAREAWGFNVQAQDARLRAAVMRKSGRFAAEAGLVEGAAARQAGKDASSASKWGVASTLIGAGSSLLATRYGFGNGNSSASPAPKGFDSSMIYAGRY